ncbi:class I SAM-dependent methyltransferase [Arenicella xantha]|uniref:class I SAM-dependent methyltransferase n=1 Tax=Arenicella xantha TaxID=644221 RepID=UPI0011BE67D6|nr:class I SAM-dependent methyltransferase [Arenicella xantha]
MSQLVRDSTELDIGDSSADQVDLIVTSAADGMHFAWTQAGSKPLRFHLDFAKTTQLLRSYPAPKQGAFNQALGKKTRHVLDATGGWGGDALLMCQQGYQVTILERDRLMACLLDDAFARLSQSSWALENGVSCPSVVHADAIEYLASRLDDVDCVYLDPMFPPKRKQSAATNKFMQFLKWWVGPDSDASELVASAIQAGYPRIAVKRPDYAEPLMGQPQTQFSSKLIHYDVYLNA